MIPALLFLAGCTAESFEPAKSDAAYLFFSGYHWVAKHSNIPVGPGPNYFSNSSDDVWVDENGRLHLKITNRNDHWYSTEVISMETFGYGQYIFYLSSRVDTLDQNVVLGLFTWDDDTFQTDANSEIDIEFARWGNSTEPGVLQYAVQPTYQGRYTERLHRPIGPLQLTGDFSTHVFSWTDTGVSFASYHDHGNPTPWPIASWEFDSTTSRPRQKLEAGEISKPVLVPKPGPTTKVHLNLWLFDANGDAYGDSPSDGKEVEVIISGFEFIPKT